LCTFQQRSWCDRYTLSLSSCRHHMFRQYTPCKLLCYQQTTQRHRFRTLSRSCRRYRMCRQHIRAKRIAPSAPQSSSCQRDKRRSLMLRESRGPSSQRHRCAWWLHQSIPRHKTGQRRSSRTLMLGWSRGLFSQGHRREKQVYQWILRRSTDQENRPRTLTLRQSRPLSQQRRGDLLHSPPIQQRSTALFCKGHTVYLPCCHGRSFQQHRRGQRQRPLNRIRSTGRRHSRRNQSLIFGHGQLCRPHRPCKLWWSW